MHMPCCTQLAVIRIGHASTLLKLHGSISRFLTGPFLFQSKTSPLGLSQGSGLSTGRPRRTLQTWGIKQVRGAPFCVCSCSAFTDNEMPPVLIDVLVLFLRLVVGIHAMPLSSIFA